MFVIVKKKSLNFVTSGFSFYSSMLPKLKSDEQLLTASIFATT